MHIADKEQPKIVAKAWRILRLSNRHVKVFTFRKHEQYRTHDTQPTDGFRATRQQPRRKQTYRVFNQTRPSYREDEHDTEEDYYRRHREQHDSRNDRRDRNLQVSNQSVHSISVKFSAPAESRTQAGANSLGVTVTNGLSVSPHVHSVIHSIMRPNTLRLACSPRPWVMR